MKIKVIKGSFGVGDIFEVRQNYSDCFLINLNDMLVAIDKEDAKVVEDVEKSCETCGLYINQLCQTVKPCSFNGYIEWQPIMRETADPSKIVKGSEQRKRLEQIVINSKGAKQSKIDTAFSLVPHDSLLAVAKVMKIGSERYEKDNWRKLSTDEIYDHLMEHLVNWHMTGNMEDLEHGVTRAMMLYSVANDGQ